MGSVRGRPPSDTVYYVALGGVFVLLLLLCCYFLYFCICRVKELATQPLPEPVKSVRPPPPPPAPAAYPVQPGVRESATAMARLCQVPAGAHTDVVYPASRSGSLPAPRIVNRPQSPTAAPSPSRVSRPHSPTSPARVLCQPHSPTSTPRSRVQSPISSPSAISRGHSPTRSPRVFHYYTQSVTNSPKILPQPRSPARQTPPIQIKVQEVD